MTTAVQAPARTPEQKYTSYAELETAQGNQAWNDGQIHRAVKLWCSAARWAQFAANTTQERAR